MKIRCAWARASQDAMIAYHDREWGVPSFDDRHLFEMLLLEGAQAGLSWTTILNKRESYRAAFDGFDAQKIARYGARKIQSLLADPGIVRNRLKVAAAVTNARAYLDLRADGQTLSDFVWQFVDGRPRVNKWKTARAVPARTRESDNLSKALAQRGFKFVGSTICYAYMQAIGMVNDHTVHCFRYLPCQARTGR